MGMRTGDRIKRSVVFWLIAAVSLAGCKSSAPKDEPTGEEEVAQSEAPVEPVMVVEYEVLEKPDDVYEGAALLTPIYFGFDSTSLDEADKAMIMSVVEWMQEHPEAELELEGHTDLEGESAYNQQLGADRADAVFEYMVEMGVSDSRLKKSTMGEQQPAVPTDESVKHWANRRVEFEVSEMPGVTPMGD